MTPTLIFALFACKDDLVETGALDSGTPSDTSTYAEPLSSFEAGQYRLDEFSIVSDNKIGFDINGDGEINNKLPAVLNLATLFIDMPLSPDELNETIAADLAKEQIVLLTDLVHVDTTLQVDVLLGSTKSGTLMVDELSYEDGEPHSRFLGAFTDETNFETVADSAAIPVPIIEGEPPVLIPLKMAQLVGVVDAKTNTGMMGGAVPIERFMDDVVEQIIPTGDAYDPDEYDGRERDELIEFIEEILGGKGVADVTLEDGSPAVSAIVEFHATATTW